MTPRVSGNVFLELAAGYPGDERALTLLGISYFGQQEWTDAIHWLTKATAVNPGFAPAYNQLGYAYRFVDRFEEAEKTFAAYTRLIPDDPNPYDSYGELLLKMGRFDDAVVQYRKALAMNPRFANSFAGISAALMYQGKHKEALGEMEHALELSRNDGERRAAFFTMAVIAMDAGKADRALVYVDKQYAVAETIRDHAAMAGDLVLQGNILLDSGKGGEAQERYDRALELIGKANLAAEVKDNAALIYHYNAGRAAVVSGDLSGPTSRRKNSSKGPRQRRTRTRSAWPTSSPG